MTTWTPTPTVSRIPTTLGIQTNLFNPAALRMSHIPQLIPSLAGGYKPSTIYPIHSGTTQMGYGNIRVPQHNGGYNPNQNYNHDGFNMLGGNTIGVGLNVQHNTSNWGTKSLPGISFLAMLNIPNIKKLTNNPMSHIPRWPPIPMKLPLDIPKF